jgi:transcription elongation factor GreA
MKFMAEELRLTAADLEALKEELDHLKTVGRKEMSEKIKTALSFGDLSENAEYDEAKSEQGKMESRINELESMIQRAVIIDESTFAKDTVNPNSKVKVKDLGLKQEFTYQLVSTTNVDPLNGMISDDSPVGKALMGHKEGDTVEVEAPSGKIEFKIVKIYKNK